jgi:hypothetical protein
MCSRHSGVTCTDGHHNSCKVSQVGINTRWRGVTDPSRRVTVSPEHVVNNKTKELAFSKPRGTRLFLLVQLQSRSGLTCLGITEL